MRGLGAVVVKVPLTRDGITACSILAKEGIRTNVTLCFSAAQALLAAKAGAGFASPFVGRLDDVASPGMEVVADVVQIYSNYYKHNNSYKRHNKMSKMHIYSYN